MEGRGLRVVVVVVGWGWGWGVKPAWFDIGDEKRYFHALRSAAFKKIGTLSRGGKSFCFLFFCFLLTKKTVDLRLLLCLSWE